MTRLRVLGLVLLGGALAAQTPTPVTLENNGKPMRIPFECSQEDVRRFGLTCPPEQPCPVYLELAGMDAAGDNVVAAGNLHAEDATLFSILLASHDGGKTWQEPYARVRGAGLDFVQLLDFETGWASGQSLGAVPRDPFLLLTHDGGKTWFNRAVFSDSRTGSIDFLRFDSKTHGTMWIDRRVSGEDGSRYEMYESMTGGESWQLREAVGTRHRAGQKIPAPADWRLRTDPHTKAYRVERRSGAGWETVASFLVRAGECREPEVVLPEPQPSAPAQDENGQAAAPRAAKPKPAAADVPKQ